MGKTLNELAQIVNGEISGDPDTKIRGISGICTAEQGHITFLSNGKYRKEIKNTEASAIVINKNLSRDLDIPAIRVNNPDLAFTQIAEVFENENKQFVPGIHETTELDPDAEVHDEVCLRSHVTVEQGATIGKGTEIMAGSYIGKDVTIGENCLVYPNANILHDSEIGSSVIIHSGSVIGCDGFGYVMDGDKRKKIPQMGKVVIEDNVEIGANVTIERARFDETRVCEGAKIDNLVQIAHNVTIGKNAVVVAQSGVAGSTEIGDRTVLAGQSGVAGHLNIGSGVKVAARAGVTKDVDDGEVVSGFPAQPRSEFNRKLVLTRKLPALADKVEELQEQVERLKSMVEKHEPKAKNNKRNR